MPGAIVIAGPAGQENGSGGTGSRAISTRDIFLAGLEVLGRSVLGRMLQDISRTSMEEIAILVDSSYAACRCHETTDVTAYGTTDVWRSAAQSLAAFRRNGVDPVLIIRLGAYVEFDPADIIQFHLDHGENLTRAYDAQGALDLWVVNAADLAETEHIRPALLSAWPQYRVRGYVNRLANLRDMRRLVVDSLSSRCLLRPVGFEVRPGVWMAEDAQVERGARIVAPAFIGRDAKISEQCLITRCSSVESNSHVDFGTVVEDSLILSNTYVGIGLDLSHSIVDGTCLLNLNRDVMLQITDPVVMQQMRQNKPRDEGNRLSRPELRRGEKALSAS